MRGGNVIQPDRKMNIPTCTLLFYIFLIFYYMFIIFLLLLLLLAKPKQHTNHYPKGPVNYNYKLIG